MKRDSIVCWGMTAASLMLGSQADAACDVLYVDIELTTGANDGSGWPGAFRDADALQDALDEAATRLGGGSPPTCVEIWVAEGTYKPSVKAIPGTSRTETFKMIDKVDLYGGFANGDASVAGRAFRCWDGSGTHGSTACTSNADCTSSERCLPLKETKLSGDIATADGTDCIGCSSPDVCVGSVCLKGDNAYHVVTYDDPGAAVTFDGFVVERGRADGTGGAYIDNQGGGITIRATKKCSMTIAISCLDNEDCPESETCVTISEPSTDGLCIDTDLAALSIANSVFRNNHALAHGALNDHGSETSIDNCLFRDNTAVVQGAAMNVDNGDASITNCLFADNSATNTAAQGGAVWIGSRSGTTGCPTDPTPSVSDCVFTGNTAVEGGAVWSKTSSPTFTDCTFDGNTATGSTDILDHRGGAVWVSDHQNCDPDLAGDPPVPDPSCFLRCTFDNNEAVRGGGLYAEATNLILDDCDFTSNEVTEAAGPTGGEGGAVYVKDAVNGEVLIKNGSDFTTNNAYRGGGAVWTDGDAGSGDAVAIDGSTFTQNTSHDKVSGAGYPGGGAIYTDTGTSLTLTSCVFDQNDSDPNEYFLTFGGAIYALNSDVQGYDCIFKGNKTATIGGAVYCELCDRCNWTNTLFSGNTIWRQTSSNKGGALYTTNTGTDETKLVNCTVVNNNAYGKGGGVFVDSGDFDAVNSIFWGNTSNVCFGTYYCQIGKGPSANVTVNYSDVDEGWPFGGTGNIDDPPDFTRYPEDCDGDGWGQVQCIGGACPTGSPDNCDDYGDLTLTSQSPPTLCIDAGDNQDGIGEGLEFVTLDLAGNDRFVEDPNATDTGDPADSCPYVDLGAYEFQVANSCCNDSECPDVCCSNICVTGDCCDDADCGTGQLCCNNTCTTGDCCVHVDCTSGNVCCSNSCTTGDCCADTDCTTGDVCCSNTCTTGDCCDASDCTGGYYCCSNTCRECCDDNNCPAQDLCCSYVCQNWDCCNASDCSAPTPACEWSTHTCVQCTSGKHCGPGNMCCFNWCVPWAPSCPL